MSPARIIRCVGKYVYDHGITDKTEIDVETLSGIRHLSLHVKDGRVESVTVDMGSPEQTSQVSEQILVGDSEFQFTGVSMGNPHGVVFVDSVDDLDLEKIGPKFENHAMFPDRVNTEFIEVIDENTLKMRVWERGAGETLACGTGACASAYAAYLNHKTGKKVLVHLTGGDLQIEYDEEKNTIFMTGPATKVFDGEIELP